MTRVLIAVGGSGGHIFPAVSFAKKMQQVHTDASILFVGGGLGSSKFFDHEAFSFQQIQCASLVLKKPWSWLKSAFKIFLGTFQSKKIIKGFSPEVIVGFGSYHSLPLLLSAKILGIPIILHEANAIPGKVNRLLSKYAQVTGIHFPEAAKHLNGKTKLVQMPLREGLHKESCSKKESLAAYGLKFGLKTILVFGGSQGAYALNKLIIASASILKKQLNDFQILHLTGSEIEADRAQKEYESIRVPACVKPFENCMQKAWASADLVIGRSGASTIAESIEFEVPSILIPYPYASDGHQLKNAHFMVNVVKGGLCYEESNITAQQFSKEILDLLEDKSIRLNQMQKAIQQYKMEAIQCDMCALVSEVISLRSTL